MRTRSRSSSLSRSAPLARLAPGPRRLAALAIGAAWLLAACRAPPASRAAVVAGAAPPGTTLYRPDPAASVINLYLRADGPLARVGHNHVISTRALEGKVWLYPQSGPSVPPGCELRLPVGAFVVDDPAERAAAGGEFAAPLDAADREGTRAHMLGDRQLDADRYPAILLRCLRVEATAGGSALELAVTVRDREVRLSVPLQVAVQGGVLRASGEFSFRQSELGLEPYSLLFGALRVADEIHARFELVARAANP